MDALTFCIVDILDLLNMPVVLEIHSSKHPAHGKENSEITRLIAEAGAAPTPSAIAAGLTL